MRAYLAILIAFVVACGVAAVLVGLTRLIQPDSKLVARNRLPAWWTSLTAWARSRSLRLWCPDPRTATVVANHLKSETGRRLSRLGVSIAEGPWAADVLVVERAKPEQLERARAQAPNPVASIVLTDATDIDEFRDALVDLSAALRWPVPPDDPTESAEPDGPNDPGKTDESAHR